jgi:hypothetical protein
MIDLTTLRALATEARQRADAATPGPWRFIRYPHRDIVCTVGDVGSPSKDVGDFVRRGDGVFAASARTDVPALCDAVEALAGEVERIRRETIEECARVCETYLRTVNEEYAQADLEYKAEVKATEAIEEQIRALAGKGEG